MQGLRAVVFDVGNVLYHWNPRALYQRLIPDDQALEAFLHDVVTFEWHAQHDAGRPFAETSAELIAKLPQHASLIERWGPDFGQTITGPVNGMAGIVADLIAQGVPIFGITNFSAEFWAPFRVREDALFRQFQDILVSGVEKIVKPDPAIFALALSRFGLGAGEALFVDDLESNIEAAQASGMMGHHFRDAPTLRSELETVGLLERQ